MNNIIKSHSGDLDQLKNVMRVFYQFVDPFSQIATTHLQDKIIKELLQPVEPETVCKTVCYVKRGVLFFFFFIIKDHWFHYIPLVKSLEQPLSPPKILAMINEGPESCKDKFF